MKKFLSDVWVGATFWGLLLGIIAGAMLLMVGLSWLGYHGLIWTLLIPAIPLGLWATGLWLREMEGR